MKQTLGVIAVVVTLFMGTSLSAQEVKTLPYQSSWEADLDDWTVADLKNTSKTWKWKAAGSLMITDSKKEQNDWLISPAMDCKGKTAVKVAFKAAWAAVQSSNITLYYSTDYEGDQATATWVKVDENIVPEDHDFGFKGDAFYPYFKKIKLKAKKVNFAIQYAPFAEAGEKQNTLRLRAFKVTAKK